MKIHEGRPSLHAEVGDIIVRQSGRRFRVAECRREGEGLVLVVRPIEEKPKVRVWLWMLISAILSAAATYWGMK